MHQDKWIDLHMHSTFSDGMHSPTKLVEIATKKKLAAICLSDHDCMDGFGELAAAADGHGLEVITGVELSCEYNGRDLHVLGYCVSVENESLQNQLIQFRETREARGLKIIEKLAELGVKIDPAVVLTKAGEGALGRPHVAEALLEAGHVSDFSEAFEKYIGENCPAYVDKYKMTPDATVDHIHEAGGLAFVAHPGYYLEDIDAFNELLDHGFDGVEVHHPHHNKNVISKLLEITKKRELLVSGGSDFHGFAGRANMGDPKVPYELLQRMKDRLNS